MNRLQHMQENVQKKNLICIKQFYITAGFLNNFKINIDKNKYLLFNTSKSEALALSPFIVQSNIFIVKYSRLLKWNTVQKHCIVIYRNNLVFMMFILVKTVLFYYSKHLCTFSSYSSSMHFIFKVKRLFYSASKLEFLFFLVTSRYLIKCAHYFWCCMRYFVHVIPIYYIAKHSISNFEV